MFCLCSAPDVCYWAENMVKYGRDWVSLWWHHAYDHRQWSLISYLVISHLAGHTQLSHSCFSHSPSPGPPVNLIMLHPTQLHQCWTHLSQLYTHYQSGLYTLHDNTPCLLVPFIWLEILSSPWASQIIPSSFAVSKNYLCTPGHNWRSIDKTLKLSLSYFWFDDVPLM